MGILKHVNKFLTDFNATQIQRFKYLAELFDMILSRPDNTERISTVPSITSKNQPTLLLLKNIIIEIKPLPRSPLLNKLQINNITAHYCFDYF